MSDEFEDDSYEEEDDLLDKQMEIEAKKESLKKQIDARRRIEQLRDERKLELSLKDDYYC